MKYKIRAFFVTLLVIFSVETAYGYTDRQNFKSTLKMDYSSILLAHLKKLTSKEFNGRKIGSKGHLLTQSYIIEHFANIEEPKNKQPIIKSNFYNQPFDYVKGFSQYSGRNLGFIKYGSQFPNKYILISAHYDHLGRSGGKIYPGADDNASGTSVLLTLKPWLNQLVTNYSIILLATDAEEPGLYGAKAFLRASEFNLEDIILNINLDMIGYGINEKYLYVAGTKKTKDFHKIIEISNVGLQVKFKPKEILTSDNFRNDTRIDLHKASDHYEFYKRGIPYLFITGGNHANYHTPNDTFANIKPNFYTKVFTSIQQLIISSDQYFARLTKKSVL